MGFGLFVIFNWVSPTGNEDNDKRIVVNRDNLITYMQHKTKVYESAKAVDIFNDLTVSKRNQLIDQYVREEALYREAKSLKLDRSDYTIRQRLIRQLEFINEGFIPLTDNNLQILLWIKRVQVQLNMCTTVG